MVSGGVLSAAHGCSKHHLGTKSGSITMVIEHSTTFGACVIYVFRGSVISKEPVIYIYAVITCGAQNRAGTTKHNAIRDCSKHHFPSLLSLNRYLFEPFSSLSS